MAAFALSSAVDATLSDDAALRCILERGMDVGGVKAIAAPTAAAAISAAAVLLGRGILLFVYL